MPTSDHLPEQWDVVVLPFPYADRLAEKRRPAVVISRKNLARDHGIVWVAMITSADNAGWRTDIPIADVGAAGLTAASVIRPAKIATVDLTRIIRRAGTISGEEARRFKDELAGYF